MSRKAWEGRRPCLPVEDGGGRGSRAGPQARQRLPFPPSSTISTSTTPPPGQRRPRRGCAGSPRAALAHGPLRNRQRRGFPRGGSAAATITQPRRRRLTKWRRPWSRRPPLPGPHFVARRAICQHGLPPPPPPPEGREMGKMPLTGDAGVGERSLRGGDHVTRGRRRRRRRSLPPPLRPSITTPHSTPLPARRSVPLRLLRVPASADGRTDGRTGGCSGGLAAG